MMIIDDAVLAPKEEAVIMVQDTACVSQCKECVSKRVQISKN